MFPTKFYPVEYLVGSVGIVSFAISFPPKVNLIAALTSEKL